MTGRTVETAVTVDLSRHVDLKAFAELASNFQATGVVDYVHMSDQLMSGSRATCGLRRTRPWRG